jgi:hypothetical protein
VCNQENAASLVYFLETEIKQIELEWGFNTQKLTAQYKGEKICPKNIMKLQLDSQEDKDITSMLNGDWGDPGRLGGPRETSQTI